MSFSSLQLSSPSCDRGTGLNSFHSNSSYSCIPPVHSLPCSKRRPSAFWGKIPTFATASSSISTPHTCTGEATLCRDEAFREATSGGSSDGTLRSGERPEFGEVNPMAQLLQKRLGGGGEDEEVGDVDTLREECGVVGIYDDPEASRLCYLAQHALHHTGQEGAGILTVSEGTLHSVSGLGLVADVFDSLSQ